MEFSQLWELCENLNKESNNLEISSILDELSMKIDLYKKVNVSASSEEKEKAKSRLFGEILLTLTNLSLKENINVFEALAVAYQSRSIDFFQIKYSE